MNREEARQILTLYRPGETGEADPQVAEALELARRDPVLRESVERDRAFHTALAEKLRGLPVPSDLKDRILARQAARSRPALLRPVFRRPAVWLAAAAALVLLLGLARWLIPTPAADRFADFRARMVGVVLRQYKMDVASQDPQAVRAYMASRGAPADYVLTPGLERLALAGGGFLRWRNQPVAMVCFRRPDREMVYLFVLRRGIAREEPSTVPTVASARQLQTAAWVTPDHLYLLAAPAEPDFPQRYR